MPPTDIAMITVTGSDLACPDSPLRTPSREVTTNDWASIEPLCNRLLSTFAAIPYAGGISAIQLGVPLRVAIVNLGRKPGAEMFIINPEIVSASDALVPRSEGCLSLPGYKASVQRHKKIRIRALDRSGREFVYSASGYESAIIQHELDHMDGRLYWDRLPANELPLRIPT